MENEINRWYKKLWETKGARFISANRLELHDKWSTITLSVVSVYIITLNLTILLENRPGIFSNGNITFSTICLSILLLVLSLIQSSRNYKIRASKYHECGRKIDDLYNKVCIWKHTDASPSIDDLKNINIEYLKLLDNYENHKQIDYSLFMSNNLSDYKEKIRCKLSFWLYVKIWYNFTTVWVYWSVLLIPLLTYLITRNPSA